MATDSANTKHGEFALIDKVLAQANKLTDRGVAKLRQRYPEATHQELIRKLEKLFVSTVTASGTATGAAAAVPGVGTAASLAATVGDSSYFLTAAAGHVLAVARIHGIDIDDHEHQRALVLTVLVGGNLAGTIGKAAERTGGHLGGKAAKAIPMETIRQINKVLGPQFVTKYGAKRGVIVLGKALPFGFGAAIGGGGNLLLAKGIVKATRRAVEDDTAPEGSEPVEAERD